MKKLMLCIMLSFGWALDGSCWITVEVNKFNKGLFGYGTVSENLLQTGGNCTYTLNCTGHGWSRCRWSQIDPTNPPSTCQSIIVSGDPTKNGLNVATDYVENQISNGNSSGTVVYPSLQITNNAGVYEDAVIVWTSTDEDNYEFKVYSHSEAVSLGLVPGL